MADKNPVWFNEEQYALWVDLADKKLTSKTFIAFTKDAYHEAVDKLNTHTP